MNLRDLTYLVAVADKRHFGKAAEACFVSQPALSMQIKKLEASLGVQLLERSNKSVLLTEIGSAIAERAREILSQAEEIREIAKSAQDPFSGKFTLGIFPTLAPYLLPHIIPPLSALFPNIAFYLSEERTEVLIEKIKQGKIHAAILALPVTDVGLSSVPLFDEEFLLTVSHTHALAKKKSVQQSDFENEDMLLLDDGHCMRNQVLNYCNEINITEAKKFRATSLETLRHMVAAGAGVTLMPKLSSEGCDLATFVPLSGPKLSRQIGMVWRNSSAKTILLQELEVQIKKILTTKKNVSVII